MRRGQTFPTAPTHPCLYVITYRSFVYSHVSRRCIDSTGDPQGYTCRHKGRASTGCHYVHTWLRSVRPWARQLAWPSAWPSARPSAWPSARSWAWPSARSWGLAVCLAIGAAVGLAVGAVVGLAVGAAVGLEAGSKRTAEIGRKSSWNGSCESGLTTSAPRLSTGKASAGGH